MNPGDTQIIAAAQVIARGTSYLNSVTKLKQYAQAVRNSYYNCFSDVPISVNKNSQVSYKYNLSQNYPNPFNPKTVINFQIPVSGNVRIVIYDILGKEVKILVDQKQTAGMHNVEFDGTIFASGVYFYKITSGDFTQTKKMVLIK
jgi:hypothetical protein